MPQAVAAKIVLAFSIESAIGVALVNIAVSAAFFAAANKYQQRRIDRKIEEDRNSATRNIVIRETLQPHTVIYGETWVGGLMSYANAVPGQYSDADNILYYDIVHCAHEVEDITQFMYDNEEVLDTTPTDGNTSTIRTDSVWYGLEDDISPVQPSVQIETHFGTDSQTVSTILNAETSDYTSNHRGRGRCHSVHRFYLSGDTEKVFNQGPPATILAKIKGRKIYDPRLDSTNGGSGSHRYTDSTTWEYSNNSILCAVDFLANFARSKIPYPKFNWAVVRDEADICDAQVPSPPDSNSPQVAARYACNGVISLGNTDKENISAILSSCIGWLSKSSGLWGVYAGSFKSESPTLNFGINQIVGNITVQTAPSRKERYNTVKATFFSNDEYAQFIESPSLTDSGFVARDNGEILNLDLDLPMTTDVYQAQRIQYKHLQQSDLLKTCTVPVNWYGLGVSPGDVISLTHAPFGWSNKLFKCLNWELGNNDAPILLTLREETSNAWADPDLSDYRTVDENNVISDDPLEVIPPSNLAAASTFDGVKVTWTLPNTFRIDSVRVYASPDSAWANAVLVFDGYANEFNHVVATTRYYWVRSVYENEESLREPNSDTSTIFAARLPRPVQDSALREYVLTRNWINYKDFDFVNGTNKGAAFANHANIFLFPGDTFASDLTVFTSNNGVDIAQPLVTNLFQDINIYAPVYAERLKVLLIVAGNRSYTSSDGINWRQSSDTLGSVNAVQSAYSPELGQFCIVGSSSFISTSPTGNLWVTRTSPAPGGHSYTDVCWANSLGLFVAVSDFSSGSPLDSVITSPDGINWTARTPAAERQWRSVCFSPELTLLVAVGEATGSSSPDVQNIMTSPDGITWTLRSAPNDSDWQYVIWVSELTLFVAVANDGTGDRIMTSPDGITWTGRSTPFQGRFNGIAWSPEKKILLIVALSDSSYSPIFSMNLISGDGINWFYRPQTNAWASLCSAPELGKLVAVASSGAGDRIMTSGDGLNWLSQSNPVDNDWQSVCWAPYAVGVSFSAPGLFVAVASTSSGSPIDNVMTSADGETWTARTGAASLQWQSVCWANTLKLFVAVASSGTGNRVMTSPDGEAWTSRTSAADLSWESICWSEELGLLCAVASTTESPINSVMTSSNGISWTSRTPAAGSAWQSVCWSPEQLIFCAVGFGGAIMTSPDGVSWTSRSAPQSINFTSVCWSRELGCFAAVASSGSGVRAAASADGITWVNFRLTELNDWQDVIWINQLGIFCAVANDGTLKSVSTTVSAYTFAYRNFLKLTG